MRSQDLIARVAVHSGMGAAHARTSIVAVMGALRRQLGGPEAEALAEALPEDLTEELRHGFYVGPDPLIERLASVEHVPLSRAAEDAASVLRAMAELLPPPLLSRLRRALPPETGVLLEAPAHETHAGHELPARPRRTLAEGRPGSRHPVSESRPPTGQSGSVASDNPHGDTKLSSSRGLTQEREAETLATGRPGPRRSLAEPDHD